MYAKNSVVDDDAQCEEVEHVCKVLPDCRGPVLPGAFEVESVGLELVSSGSCAYLCGKGRASDFRSLVLLSRRVPLASIPLSRDRELHSIDRSLESLF